MIPTGYLFTRVMTEDQLRDFSRGTKQLIAAKIWVKVTIFPFQNTEIDLRYRHTYRI